ALPEPSARRPRGRCSRRWVQTEAGVPAHFLLYPSLASLEEFAGATRRPDTMITVGVGVTDHSFELSLFLEMEDIVDTDVQLAAVGAYVKRTTGEWGRQRALPARHHCHWASGTVSAYAVEPVTK